MPKYSLPPKLDELDDQVKLSYGYKGNNRLKVQIVQFIEWHNKKHEKRNKKKIENERNDGWLRQLVSEEYLSLISFFFFGNGTVDKKVISLKKVFAYAIGTNKEDNNNDEDKIPGFCLFREKLLSHVSIKVDNQEEFKFKLLAAIKNSHEINNINKQHPVIDLLSDINKDLGSGWLFELNIKWKRIADRPKLEWYLAVALYNIIGVGSNDDFCEVLAFAFGAQAKQSKDRKKWVTGIARGYHMEYLTQTSDGTSLTTTVTAPTAALTKEASTIDMSPLLMSPITKKPLEIVTTINDDNDDMVISPLTDINNNTAVRFFKNFSPRRSISLSISRVANALTPSKIKRTSGSRSKTLRKFQSLQFTLSSRLLFLLDYHYYN